MTISQKSTKQICMCCFAISFCLFFYQFFGILPLLFDFSFPLVFLQQMVPAIFDKDLTTVNAIANRAQKNSPYTYCLKKQRLGLDYKRFADVSVHANSPFCTCSLSKLWSRLTFLPTRKVSWCFLLHRHQLCKQYQGLHPSHYYTGKTSGLVYMPQREFTFLLFK